MWSGPNQPADQSPSQHTDRPTSSDLPGTEVLLQGTSIPANLTLMDFRPDWPRTAEITGNDHPALQRQSTSKSAFEPTRRDSFSSESDSDSVLSDWPPVDIYVEEGELSGDQDVTITDRDQYLWGTDLQRDHGGGGFGCTLAGHTSQILTLVLPHQMTTLLPAINFRLEEKCLFNSPQTIDCAEKSASLT